MTRDDRARIRESVRWLKPGQSVEVRVATLRALLDEADRLEAQVGALVDVEAIEVGDAG